MKTTILSAFIFLTLISNIAFGANSVLTEYNGQAKMKLTYIATGWNSENDDKCGFVSTLILGVYTLGIGPVATCIRDESKTTALDVQLKAELNELDNGRATIKLNSENIKNCAGLSSLIYAELDGFGSYDLYASKEDWTNGEKLGSAVKQNGSLEISFIKDDVSISSLGKKGKSCVFQLGQNFHVNFSSSK